jgi:hypothetical protein
MYAEGVYAYPFLLLFDPRKKGTCKVATPLQL